MQTKQFFLFAFFSNSDLHMNKVCTPFSYYFGNIGTVSNFWTPHDIILSHLKFMLPCNNLDEITGSSLSGKWRLASCRTGGDQ